jgi:hypothetical protein
MAGTLVPWGVRWGWKGAEGFGCEGSGVTETCLWKSTSPRREPQGRGDKGRGRNLHGKEGDWTQIYVTKQKEPQWWAYLRKYIQVNWGHCTWRIPPGWPGTTAPCLRERERDGIWFGNWHTTPERSLQGKQRKAEKRKHSHIPVCRTGTPQEAPCLSPREPVETHPAHQAHLSWLFT